MNYNKILIAIITGIFISSCSDNDAVKASFNAQKSSSNTEPLLLGGDGNCINYDLDASKSTSNNNKHKINKYTWKFEDLDEPVITNTPHVTHCFPRRPEGMLGINLQGYEVELEVSNGRSQDEAKKIIKPSNIAPTVVIDINKISDDGYTYTFDAFESSDPDGEIVSYEWASDSGPYIDTNLNTHSVKFSTPGQHIIKLKITDDIGDSAESHLDVFVVTDPKINSISVTPLLGSDGSKYQLSSDVEFGDIRDDLEYEWKDNGSIISNTNSFIHDFTNGIHTISLTVKQIQRSTSDTKTQTIDVNIHNDPVIDNINATPHADGVTYDLLANTTNESGHHLTYTWLIDNTTAGSGTSITHLFTEGEHKVKFTILDNQTGKSITKEIDLQVKKIIPLQAVISDQYTCDMLNCTFSADGSKGDIKNYNWTFSDGKSEITTVNNVSHAYTIDNFLDKNISASVDLVVTNDGNATSAKASKVIQITNDWQPSISIFNGKVEIFNTVMAYNNTFPEYSVSPGKPRLTSVSWAISPNNSNWRSFYGSQVDSLTNVSGFGTYYGRSCFEATYNNKSVKLGYSFTFDYNTQITMSTLQRDDSLNCDF